MKLLTRILIVEDNPDDEALVLRELKKANMADDLMVIRDGAEALSFLSDKTFDGEDIAAVFLDLKLPKIAGDSAAKDESTIAIKKKRKPQTNGASEIWRWTALPSLQTGLSAGRMPKVGEPNANRVSRNPSSSQSCT